VSDTSESVKATCKPIAKECKALLTKSFGDKINYSVIPNNRVTSVSCRLLEPRLSIIHSARLHKLLWPENCTSAKMLAHSILTFKLVLRALKAQCTGRDNDLHTHHIHLPGQNKVNIELNIKSPSPSRFSSLIHIPQRHHSQDPLRVLRLIRLTADALTSHTSSIHELDRQQTMCVTSFIID